MIDLVSDRIVEDEGEGNEGGEDSNGGGGEPSNSKSSESISSTIRGGTRGAAAGTELAARPLEGTLKLGALSIR